nr:MAG TPA: hypothetical protein [Caudoviricetes sp.]DAT23344.1 MAG TPA: hypothetical protein [Caudoviricetes sp.]
MKNRLTRRVSAIPFKNSYSHIAFTTFVSNNYEIWRNYLSTKTL